MASANEILKQLKSKANAENVQGMARFDMATDKRLGISIPELRKLAKATGKDHELALELWKTGIPEAQIVAALVAEPDKLTSGQMDTWVKDFNSWDVCDQVCMNLFDKTPLAWGKIHEWSQRDEKFVKRAAFALIACLAWHNKTASDEAFANLVPVIEIGATDARNYVKKAVSWALRHIGKRNPNLHEVAMQAAEKMQQSESKAARWIAADAIRDLTSDTTKD
ncbi:MAG: DNA alkylation repair protein [bacterium]